MIIRQTVQNIINFTSAQSIEGECIIVREKDLMVLRKGVVYGGRACCNMFSMMDSGAFLPMLPVQLLTQSLLYDVSQISIPGTGWMISLFYNPKMECIRHSMLHSFY